MNTARKTFLSTSFFNLATEQQKILSNFPVKKNYLKIKYLQYIYTWFKPEVKTNKKQPTTRKCWKELKAVEKVLRIQLVRVQSEAIGAANFRKACRSPGHVEEVPTGNLLRREHDERQFESVEGRNPGSGRRGM